MAFDNPEPEWKAALKEMSQNIIQMAEEVEKLRMALAPLLEKHQREEKQRQELDREHQVFMQAQARIAEHYAARPIGVYGECDCSPNRTAALAGQFSSWIDDQIARYNKKN